MARDPGSLWSPLLENGRQGSYTKTQFIVHSTGDRGTAAAIYNYFNRAEVVVESTFVVGRGPEDPTRQLLDSSAGADANLSANQRAIAVEVVGAAGDDYTEWQVSEIIRLGRWARATHPIEPRICPAHNASGFGYHVLFGAPGPWTPVAKSCPGPVRIQRLRGRIFPAIFNNSQEDDVSWTDNLGSQGGIGDPNNGATAAQILWHGTIQASQASSKADVIQQQIAGLSAAVAALAAKPATDVDEGALAAALAPMLSSQVSSLSADDLSKIATAVADEQARRQVS